MSTSGHGACRVFEKPSFLHFARVSPCHLRMQHREAKSLFSLLTQEAQGLVQKLSPGRRARQSSPRPPRGVQDLCSVPQERAAHSPPTTRRRQARQVLYMEPAAPDLRRVPALPSGRAGLPPEMHGQQPSDSAGRVVPRVMARAPRLTTTPPSTASLTRGSGACLRGQSSRHSPAEPRTDRAPGSSPGSCPPSRRLWPGLQLASEAGRIRTV